MEDVGAEIREHAIEQIRDEEATGEEQVANSPRERRLELAVTILLSVSALLSAWCAYQASRLSGQESLYNTRASVLQVQAFRAEQRSTIETLTDLSAFERWLAATSEGDTTRARYVEARFSDRLSTAFTEWLKLNPLADENAPASPIDTDVYERPDEAAAMRYELDAQAAEDRAASAGDAADNYVLAVVLLAAALFLLGIQSRIGVFELRVAMTSVAGALVVGTIVWVLILPSSVGS
ncbi:MAG: hypothetical protein ACOYML_09100 [Microthrixaceae bacterium]|jgi:hypothetical protein